MVPLQPQLPLLRSQRQRQEICTAGIYRIDDMILAHFVDFTEAGIHRSHADQAARHGIEFPGSRGSDTFRAAEQEDGKASRDRAAGLKPVEEIGACRSFVDRQAEKSGDPDNWRAVRRTKIAIQQRLPEFRIRQAVHQEVEVGSRDEKNRAIGCCRFYPVYDGRDVDGIDRHAQDAIDRTRKVGLRGRVHRRRAADRVRSGQVSTLVQGFGERPRWRHKIHLV